LISEDNDRFDGFPGIRLGLAHGDQTGDVVLSPFHGDESKAGKMDWPAGTRLAISCPFCNAVLPKLATCGCPERGDLVKLFLTPELSDSHLLAVCNIWGCRRSRTIDNWQIISEFLEGQIED
jgi:hypothetical protein